MHALQAFCSHEKGLPHVSTTALSFRLCLLYLLQVFLYSAQQYIVSIAHSIASPFAMSSFACSRSLALIISHLQTCAQSHAFKRSINRSILSSVLRAFINACVLQNLHEHQSNLLLHNFMDIFGIYLAVSGQKFLRPVRVSCEHLVLPKISRKGSLLPSLPSLFSDGQEARQVPLLRSGRCFPF